MHRVRADNDTIHSSLPFSDQSPTTCAVVRGGEANILWLDEVPKMQQTVTNRLFNQVFMAVLLFVNVVQLLFRPFRFSAGKFARAAFWRPGKPPKFPKAKPSTVLRNTTQTEVSREMVPPRSISFLVASFSNQGRLGLRRPQETLLFNKSLTLGSLLAVSIFYSLLLFVDVLNQLLFRS